MRIGGHAVLFKEQISTDTVKVLRDLKNAGSDITEIGARFFGVERADELNAALAETGMHLGGVHAAKKLVEFLDKPEECRTYLRGVAEFLLKTECRRIIMTGGVGKPDWNQDDLGDIRLLDAECVKQIALNINSIAKEIRDEYGVQINYHNHNWEFKHNGLIYESLIKYAPDLWFGLDIGWAGVSGYEPAALIRRLQGRIGYIHLRDYKEESKKLTVFEDIQDAYTEVGEGDLDYKELLSTYIEVAGEDACAVVEYERGAQDIKRIENALNYVKKVLGEINA